MLKLTPEAIKFILLQRTQLKEGCTAEEIEADFRKDFETYKDCLPEFEYHDKISVVDIGSGIGVQDVLLSEHYGGDIDLMIIDKDETEDVVWYGFKDNGAFYNSFQAQASTLVNNRIRTSKFQEATDDYKVKADNESVDLVTSFIAWGFHFPVDTYIDEVVRVMKPGAVLILDIRKDVGGMKKLVSYGAEVFTNIKVIKDFRKYQRVFLQKRV